MLVGIGCKVPKGVDLQKDSANNLFIQTIMEEEYRVKDLHKKQIQQTAENPRIRDQNETTDISTELRAQKHEDILEVKRRQQLRQNNMELRQLEIQLRAALVSKQLADQKIALDKEKEEIRRAKQEEVVKYEKERVRCQEMQRESELKERQKREQFRGVLLSQMSETAARRKMEYEEVLKERDEMDKLLARYKAENELEMRELARRKVASKKEMEDFVKVQHEIRRKEMPSDRSEMESYTQMMKQRDDEKQQILEERRKLTAMREMLSNSIGQQLLNVQNEKMRRENLLLDLLVEERNTKEDERFRQNLEKDEQNRIQMRMEFDRYRYELERRRIEREENEDSVFRAEMQRQLAERDRLDQLAEDKRRQKLKEHGRAIQELIEGKRRQRALDAAEELKMHELIRKQETEQDELVEQERLRMLSKAPPDVLRYLPASVLRESDRKILGLPSKVKK